MFQRKKRKLDPKVKYQQPQFKRKLEKAKTYRRPGGAHALTYAKVRSVLHKLPLRWVFFVCVLLGLFVYVSFFAQFLFVRTIEVQGAAEQLAGEVRTQIERYMSDRLFLLPKQNMLFLQKRDLAEYIRVTNTHVLAVDTIDKKWPNKLVVAVRPREPFFAWEWEGKKAAIANDGMALPETEARASGLFTVSGPMPYEPRVGDAFFSGDLLNTLTVLRADFSAQTGLPSLQRVNFIPVVSEPVATNPEATEKQEVPAVPVAAKVLPVLPHELYAVVQADTAGRTPEFTVIFDVDDKARDALQQLRLLVSQQSAERLHKLLYIDMRFAGRAFICLQGSGCALPSSNSPVSRTTESSN